MNGAKNREIIFEYISMGKIIRVTAIDAVTGVEVVLQAPINTPAADLKRMAIRKLDYVISKSCPNGQHN